MVATWQNIPSEPSKGDAKPAPEAPVQTAQSESPAAAPEPPAIMTYLPFIVLGLMVVLMMWSSRSNQKKQEKTLSALKKGDVVLTQAGIRGKIVELGDRFAKVEIAAGTKVEILKTSILGKDGAEAAAQLEKK